MWKRKISNKFFCMFLVGAITLLGTICFATNNSLNWDYLVETSQAFEKTTVGIFKKAAFMCYGSTMVDGNYRAGVRVFLQQLNENDDWVTAYSWDDFDVVGLAAVEETQTVDAGTYRLMVQHIAYPEDDVDYQHALETHISYSAIEVY